MAVKKMWGGRFSEGNSSLTEEYTESVSYDRELYRQDIRGSLAHARMLARQGVLTPGEAEGLARGLEAVQKEIEAGSFVWKRELEDVHMNIESRLT
ncbi:MAG: argininosuccinate lyase, partial [Deltaproteobacteria bacterium]|nr:argininosuccinate lyase [Deltaproteobacteria bacterium]